MHTYHFKLGSNYIWIEIGIELEHNKNCFKLKSKWKYLEREEHWLVEGRCQTYIQKGKQENLEKYRKVKSTLIHVGFYAAVPLKNFEVWDGEEVYWAQPVWIYDKRFLLYHLMCSHDEIATTIYRWYLSCLSIPPPAVFCYTNCSLGGPERISWRPTQKYDKLYT